MNRALCPSHYVHLFDTVEQISNFKYIVRKHLRVLFLFCKSVNAYICVSNALQFSFIQYQCFDVFCISLDNFEKRSSSVLNEWPYSKLYSVHFSVELPFTTPQPGIVVPIFKLVRSRGT